MSLSKLAKPYREMLALQAMLRFIEFPANRMVPALHSDGRSLGLEVHSKDDKCALIIGAGQFKKRKTVEEVTAEWVAIVVAWNNAQDEDRAKILRESDSRTFILDMYVALNECGIVNINRIEMPCPYCDRPMVIELRTKDVEHQDPPCESLAHWKMIASALQSPWLPN